MRRTRELRHTSRALASLVSVPAQVYADRRRALCRTLAPHTILLIPAADEVAFSHDIFYPFQQDAMFSHLFGISEPLRRCLAPPTAVATEDLRATMAAFTKNAHGACRVFLFVPEPTRDASTAVWATAPHSIDSAQPSLAPSEDVPVRVFANQVDQIAKVLGECVMHMVRRQQKGQDSSGVPSTAEALTYAKQLLPTVQMAFPLQVRMHNERYRILRPTRVPTEPSRASRGYPHSEGSDNAVRVLHPLEALLAHLLARPHDVSLKGTVGDQSPQHVRLSYALPTRAGTPPGECVALLTPPNDTVDVLREWYVASAPEQPAAVAPVAIPSRIRSARDTLFRYRLYKSPSQLSQHLVSARITRDAFLAAIRAASACTSEFDIHCAFDASLLVSRQRLGPAACVQSAYVPVVAAGEHATEIHYIENNGEGRIGDLVRLDGGALVCQVPTDCTRTFPLGQARFGRDPLQTTAYDALLALQRQLVKAIAPGVPPYDVARLHVSSTRDHLQALGVGHRTLGQDKTEPLFDLSLVHKVFCAHGYGHFFGLDLHEMHIAKPVLTNATTTTTNGTMAPAGIPQKPKLTYAPVLFEGGMMHTVEPGFYFPSQARAERYQYDSRAISLVPPALRGVGMQIEDDVFVLPTEAEVGKSGEPSMSSAPTRVDFLSAAVRTHQALVQWDRDGSKALGNSTRLPLCCLLRHTQAMAAVGLEDCPPLVFAAVSFVFEQRACIESVSMALAALPEDAQLCRIAFAENEKQGMASFASHYPFHVVVTTACVPKEVKDIESISA